MKVLLSFQKSCWVFINIWRSFWKICQNFTKILRFSTYFWKFYYIELRFWEILKSKNFLFLEFFNLCWVFQKKFWDFWIFCQKSLMFIFISHFNTRTVNNFISCDFIEPWPDFPHMCVPLYPRQQENYFWSIGIILMHFNFDYELTISECKWC